MVEYRYPDSLPCAQPGVLSPRERRAASAREGPLQLRARQRDFAGAVSSYVFTYTAEEIGIWRNWYKQELLDGRRTFAIDLPGRGGLATRVVRYHSVQETYLGLGIYRIQATFEQRGASLNPRTTSVYSIDLSSIGNAGSNSSVGVLLSGLDASSEYRLTLPTGRLYVAYSYFATDGEAVVPGKAWANGFIATGGPGASVGYTDPRSTIIGSAPEDPQWPNAEAARAAFVPQIITGYSEYRFWIYDSLISDNRGGLSILMTEL